MVHSLLDERETMIPNTGGSLGSIAPPANLRR
jgi:hypothetical protein